MKTRLTFALTFICCAVILASLSHAQSGGGSSPALGGATFPLSAPNGSTAAPSYSFTNQTGTGMFYNGVGILWAVNGTLQAFLAPNASGGFTSTPAITAPAYITTTNCAVNGVSPAACGSAASGVIAVPTTTTTYTVNTTAVTANSRIFLQQTADNTGIPSAPTCATVNGVGANAVAQPTGRTAATSFTFSIPSTTGITCFYYWIVD